MRHRAKFRGNRSNRCRDMAIFQFFSKMAAVRHLRFLNFQILNRRHVYGGQFRDGPRTADDMTIFRFLKMASVRHLGFQIFKILTVNTLEGVNMRTRIEFRCVSSNRR